MAKIHHQAWPTKNISSNETAPYIYATKSKNTDSYTKLKHDTVFKSNFKCAYPRSKNPRKLSNTLFTISLGQEKEPHLQEEHNRTYFQNAKRLHINYYHQ